METTNNVIEHSASSNGSDEPSLNVGHPYSVKITRNSKGVNWEFAVRGDNKRKVMDDIDSLISHLEARIPMIT